MPNRSTNIDVRTSWEIHAIESWNTQQRILVDSINDTARMARTTLSLVLLVAIYMCLTLFVSDKEMLYNKQVVIPQTNIGIAIRTSYIITPLIFLYLHAQVLFLLSVLTQKIRRFIRASNAGPPVRNLSTRTQGEAEESWDWLSAFVFVQLFMPNGSRRYLPMMLSFIGIVVFPILLLLLIDLRFIRYQEIETTLLHHAILVLDIMLIVFLFTRRILQMQRAYSVISMMSAALFLGVCLLLSAQLPKFNYSEIEKNLSRNDNEMILPVHNNVLCNFLGLCHYIDINDKSLISTWVDLPDSASVGFRNKDSEIRQLATNRLDLVDRTLLYACFRSSKLYGVDFILSDLRGADFGRAHIYYSNFSNAELHGVNFGDTKLYDVDLAGAKLHYANLRGAELHGVDFGGAELHGANLSGQKPSDSKNEHILGMQKCVKPAYNRSKSYAYNRSKSYAYNRSESYASNRSESYKGHLTPSDSDTKLHGADLRFAKLHGANLERAELYGADLRNAKLHGANLRYAKLNGADLRYAQLYGANLEGATLDGADLMNAELAGSFGRPESQRFVLRGDASQDADIEDIITKSTDQFRNTVRESSKVREYEIFFRRAMDMGKNGVMLEKIQDPEELQRDDADKEFWEEYSKLWSSLACRNKYTARMILKRWGSDDPPHDSEIAICIITRELEKARREDREKWQCPGLRAVADDEWYEWRYKFQLRDPSVEFCEKN